MLLTITQRRIAVQYVIKSILSASSASPSWLSVRLAVEERANDGIDLQTEVSMEALCRKEDGGQKYDDDYDW